MATSKSSNSAPLGIRKVERPRPLRSISHTGIPSSNLTNASSNSQRRNSSQDIPMDEIVKLLELIPQQLETKNYNETCVKAVIRLNSALKQHGSQLEHFHRDLLDKAQISLRNACKDTNLSITARLHILEIIELRSMKWTQNESTRNFYAQQMSSMAPKPDENDASKQLNVNAPTFQPNPNIPSSNGGNILNQLFQNASIVPSGEVMVGSGKYSGPTQPHGKSYYKDEIFIRNADSGKVMGVKGRRVHMIEEMSDTIISFQRVAPGSLDRLVQITGSASENVAQAKNLVHDTIRRNQSPLPDTFGDHNDDGGRGGGTGNRPNRTGERQFSLESFSSQKNEFKFSVKVADKGTVMLSSSNLDLVKSAKIALEEHFSGKSYSVAPLGSGVPPPAGHRMDILRIPIYENSSVAQIHLAEAEDARSKERRAKFAKTAANRKLNEANKNDAGLSQQQSKNYDRDFLLSFTSKPASIKMSANLEKVLKELDLERKEKVMFDGAKYAAMPKSAILPHSALIYQNLITTDAITEDED